MSVITYPPKPFHRCTRQQLLTLAIALEAMRDECIERLNAVHELVEHARQTSPSDRMCLYVTDVEVALGLRPADTPEVRKLGGNDGSIRPKEGTA